MQFFPNISVRNVTNKTINFVDTKTDVHQYLYDSHDETSDWRERAMTLSTKNCREVFLWYEGDLPRCSLQNTKTKLYVTILSTNKFSFLFRSCFYKRNSIIIHKSRMKWGLKNPIKCHLTPFSVVNVRLW